MTKVAQRPAISVVIPTFNGKSLLAQYLPSVLSAMQSGDELLVVDDASQDETVAWLIERYALKQTAKTAEATTYSGQLSSAKTRLTISLVAQTQNQRFGATTNRGVLAAKQPLVFVVNNDVKVQPDIFEFLAPHFQDASVFGVGCLELEGVEHTKQVEQFRAGKLAPDSGVKVGGKNRLWFERGLFQHARAAELSSGPTAWVSGGSGLFDRQKWLDLGGFDPRYYPAYWEDIDLSERARRRGWQVLFEAQAIVEHRHETTHQTVFKQSQLIKQSWLHSLAFTWRFGNWGQRVAMLLWLPYYLVKLRRAWWSS